MVVTETSCQCSGCCKGPEGWAAVKEKQMTLGGLYNAGWSELCHWAHLAARPRAPRFLVGGRNWLRLKPRGTENEVALTQQRVVICCTLPQGPPAEVDHDPPEQLLCSPHSSTSGLDSPEDHTRSVQLSHTRIKQEAHSQIGSFLKGLCIRLKAHIFHFFIACENISWSDTYTWRRMFVRDFQQLHFGLVQNQRNVNWSGSFRLKKYFVTAIVQTALLVFKWWMLTENDKYLINHNTGYFWFVVPASVR